MRGECKFRSIIESLDSHAAIDLLTATCSCDIEVAALVTGLFRRRFENFAMTGGQTSSVIPQSAPQQPRTHQHSEEATAVPIPEPIDPDPGVEDVELPEEAESEESDEDDSSKEEGDGSESEGGSDNSDY